MPGPCNAKRKIKQQEKKKKAALSKEKIVLSESHEEQHRPQAALDIPDHEDFNPPNSSSSCPLVPPPALPEITESSAPDSIAEALRQPFITDPGNGPRVKDVRAFLSSFFVPSPSLNDRICEAFSNEAVCAALQTILPTEIALITWYNKTRLLNRICPSCQRLYRLGDALQDPITGSLVDTRSPSTPPQVLREQQISGICSSACFLLASYTSHPHVAQVASGAWGRVRSEIDHSTTVILDTTADLFTSTFTRGKADWGKVMDNLEDQGLGRMLRLTRLDEIQLLTLLQYQCSSQGTTNKELTLETTELLPPGPAIVDTVF